MSNSADAQNVRSSTALYVALWPHKEAMLKRWVEIVHGTYPFETIGFLRTRKDQFANPVGFRTEEAAAVLVDLFFTDQPDEVQIRSAIEEIMRVRAIQEFAPEVAVGVFFALKDIVRETVKNSGQAEQCYPALLTLESRIDAVVLLAFGEYARCREKLHMLKVDEFKRRHSQVLRLAERKSYISEEAENHNP